MTDSAGISPEDWAALRRAAACLEHPSLAARLTSVLGTPIEEGAKLLPVSWYRRLRQATDAAILRTLDVAVSTLRAEGVAPSETRHRNLGMATGAIGGYFGLPGLLVELPFTTMLMLRSIAAIAKREGEDLDDPQARLSCVKVFALGGRPASDDAAETGYLGLRMMLAYQFSTVSEAVVERGLAVRQVPAVVNVVRAIAARFGVVVSDKAAFQMVPVFGAIGGAALNTIFMDHFQAMAASHFAVRRLERKYGEAAVRQAYRSVADLARTQAADGARPAATRT